VIKKYRDKIWLEKKYLEEKLSTYQIADLLGVNRELIKYWLQKFNIPIRSHREALRIYSMYYNINRIKKREQSEKTKRKIKEANLGRKVSEKTKQKISKFFKGRKRSRKIKEKISKGLKKIYREHKRIGISKKGKDSYFWKGGKMAEYPENERIRKSSEFQLWRKAIFTRDNFTCQCCGKTGGYLNAHHINNFADFPELRLAIDNGITLCRECHFEFHKIYGKDNNTREQLEEFFDSKINGRGK